MFRRRSTGSAYLISKNQNSELLRYKSSSIIPFITVCKYDSFNSIYVVFLFIPSYAYLYTVRVIFERTKNIRKKLLFFLSSSESHPSLSPSVTHPFPVLSITEHLLPGYRSSVSVRRLIYPFFLEA